jgi:hypothetical protein
MREETTDRNTTDRGEDSEHNPSQQPGRGHSSGKSKEEICLELAKLCQESFDGRRLWERKIAFGLWTGLGVLTYFAILHPDAISTLTLVALAVGYIIVGTIWCVFWQPALRAAYDQDQAWKHYYMHRAENRPLDRSDPDPWLPKDERARRRREFCIAWSQSWTKVQAIGTIIILLVSWFFIFGISGAKSKFDDKDRVSVSGDNATKVVNKLTK